MQCKNPHSPEPKKGSFWRIIVQTEAEKFPPVFPKGFKGSKYISTQLLIKVPSPPSPWDCGYLTPSNTKSPPPPLSWSFLRPSPPPRLVLWTSPWCARHAQVLSAGFAHPGEWRLFPLTHFLSTAHQLLIAFSAKVLFATAHHPDGLNMRIRGYLRRAHSTGPRTQKALHPETRESEHCSVVSLRPHGLHSPWNSPGRNTGVGSLSLLQGFCPTQGSSPGLPHCRLILYQLN